MYSITVLFHYCLPLNRKTENEKWSFFVKKFLVFSKLIYVFPFLVLLLIEAGFFSDSCLHLGNVDKKTIFRVTQNGCKTTQNFFSKQPENLFSHCIKTLEIQMSIEKIYFQRIGKRLTRKTWKWNFLLHFKNEYVFCKITFH